MNNIENKRRVLSNIKGINFKDLLDLSKKNYIPISDKKNKHLECVKISLEKYNLPVNILNQIDVGNSLTYRINQYKLEKKYFDAFNEFFNNNINNIVIKNINPGGTIISHLDTSKIDDPYTVFIIPLEDSIIGQGIVYEDQAILSWKAGDVFVIDVTKYLHYAFNCSYIDSNLLRISVRNNKKVFDVLSGKFPIIDFNMNVGF